MNQTTMRETNEPNYFDVKHLIYGLRQWPEH